MHSFSLSRAGTNSVSYSLPFSFDKVAPSTTHGSRSSRPLITLGSPVSLAHTSLIIILCCLITGLLDSTLFYAYGTFVSGQTGNTVLFGLGASTSHITARPYGWAKSLVAIVSFVWGCAVFSHTTRILGDRRRGTLVLSFFVQGGIVLAAAGFIQSALVEGRLHLLNNEIDWRQCLPIALLSFQSAGQIVASRTLGHDTIPTIVMTGMLHDIASDPHLFVTWCKNEKRFQRLGAYAAVVVGAVAGGFLSVKTGKMENTLWLVGCLKIAIAATWGFWPAAEAEHEVHV